MIQQIIPAQPQPVPKSQPNQTQQDPAQSFESAIRQAAGLRDGETKDNSSASGRAKDDPTEKKPDSVNAQAAALVGLNASLPAVLPLVPDALTGAAESRMSVFPAAVDPGASPQPAVSAVEALSAPAVSTDVKSADSIPKQAKGTDPILQTAAAQTTEASQKSAETAAASPVQTFSAPAQQAVLLSADASPAVRQSAEPGRPFDTAVPAQKDAADPQRVNSAAEQTLSATTVSPSAASAQSGKADSSGAKAGSDAQPSLVFRTEEKHEPDKAIPSGDHVSSYSEMMQTGNVVIKISGAASDPVKPAVRQVADNVLTHVRAGDSRFEMELFPKDLGKVTVKLAAQNGVITVEIAAADPKTHNMLLSGAGEIRSMLESAVNQPVHVREAAQNAPWDPQQGRNPSHSGQEENRQNRQPSYRADRDDTDSGTEDFLSMLQQLRIKTVMV